MIAWEEISEEPRDMERDAKGGIGKGELEGWPREPKAYPYQQSVISTRKEQLVELLKKYEDVFAWTYDKMLGLDPKLVVHSLNVDPKTKPMI